MKDNSDSHGEMGLSDGRSNIDDFDPWGECRHWFGVSDSLDVQWAPFLTAAALDQTFPKFVLDPITFLPEDEQ